MKQHFTVATYNVHRWIGNDGRRQPKRTLRVIKSLRADVIALQEVSFSSRDRRDFSLEDLARATGIKVLPGLTLFREDTDYGNTLLTVHPVQRSRFIDISIQGHEPRGVIDVALDIRGQSVRVLATHLGLERHERKKQIQCILDEIDMCSDEVLILMGDLNEWNPFSISLKLLRDYFDRLLAPKSYPSKFPLLALDRILVRPRGLVTSIGAVNMPLTRIASDHLPLRANVDL